MPHEGRRAECGHVFATSQGLRPALDLIGRRWRSLPARIGPPGNVEPKIQSGVGPDSQPELVPATSTAEGDGVLSQTPEPLRIAPRQPQNLDQDRLDHVDRHSDGLAPGFRYINPSGLSFLGLHAGSSPLQRFLLDRGCLRCRHARASRGRRRLPRLSLPSRYLEEMGEPRSNPRLRMGAFPEVGRDRIFKSKLNSPSMRRRRSTELVLPLRALTYLFALAATCDRC